MAAKVVTITSGKGGVGKTTITANLGVALAALEQKVVCIDSDIGLWRLTPILGCAILTWLWGWRTALFMTL